MANRACGALLLALFGCVQVAVAQSTPMRVLYAEPFDVQVPSAASAQKPGRQRVSLQAFSRNFQLQLEDNSRLLRGAPASIVQQARSARLLKGTIEGMPDSWIRLALFDGSYHGAIWDGSELYFVEPQTVVGPMLLGPLSGATSSSAIYRLSDTQGGVLESSCGVAASEAAQLSPLARYRKLIDELRGAASAAFATAPREIEVSMIGDFEFTSLRGPLALYEMLSYMNAVDGIFSAQVGVTIVPTDFITFPTDTDPFTSSTASILLGQVGQYRNSTPAVRNRGLAHLLTGRNLDGTTAGIAFLGSLCEPFQGVGLTETTFQFATALIVAHELGHNFGAPHDSEPGACASTPPQFLMSPQFNSSTTFSACSLQQMQPEIAGAACVVTARNRDVAVTGPAEIRGVANQSFELAVDIASVGDAPALNVIVSATLLADSVSLPGATCTNNNGNINCVIPEFPAGESRRMSMTLIRPASTEFEARVNVSSTNDSNVANNSHPVRVIVSAERDFSIAVAPQPLTVTRGEPFEMTFDITATGSQPLSNLAVALDAVGAVAAATIDDGSCSIGASVTCTIGSLPLGVVRRLRVQTISNIIGTSTGLIRVIDSGPGNAQRVRTFDVTTRPVRDIAVFAESPFSAVPIGADALWDTEVRSNGAQPVDDVVLRLTTDASLSVDGPIGAGCTRAGGITECPLGTIAAGAVLPIRLRTRSDVPLTASLRMEVVLPSPDEVMGNDVLQRLLDFRLADDVELTTFGQGPTFDTRVALFHASVRARGANPSTDVRATVAFPSGFSIQSARLDQTPCTIDSNAPHLATCALPTLGTVFSVSLMIEYVAPEPGTYVGSISVTSRDDADPSNNSRTVNFVISPNVDGQVQGPTGLRPVRLDATTDFLFTVSTNRYTLPDATINVSWSGPQLSATVIGVSCTTGPSGFGFNCPLGTIAPNSNIPITVRVQGITAGGSGGVHVGLSSPGETNFSNNAAQAQFLTVMPADVAAVLPQSSVTATAGAPTQVAADLTVITPEVLDGFIEFQFDPTRVQNPATQGADFCNASTQAARCRFSFLGSPGANRVMLNFLPQGTGPLQITVRAGAFNDFNGANDVQTMTVNVQAPSPPPPPPAPPSPPSSSGGGGGGGGGGMSWLTATLLLLLLRTVRRASVRHVSSG